MSSMKPIIVILGAGSNIGYNVAQAFRSKGYQTVLASRSIDAVNNEADLALKADLSDPSAIIDVFTKVRASLGIPSVVVYNAAAASRGPPEDPLSVPLAAFAKDLNINTTSVFAAAQQAVLCFKQLSESASKTFIYTGNILNTTTMAPLLTLGVGKSATAHIIETAAKVYEKQGFKFYYGDERLPDGTPAFDVSGPAHGKMYVELAEHKSQGLWHHTFIKDVGYKAF